MKINHKNIGDVQKHVYLKGIILKVYSADEEDFDGEPEESRIDTADIKIAFTRKDKDGYDSEEVEIFGDRIPIFYHCKPDSVKRANGALEDASSAFSEDDEIIVQCEIISDKHYKPLRVMGFMDKPKSCAWRFNLFIDDDTTKRDADGKITEASGLPVDIYNLGDISIYSNGESGDTYHGRIAGYFADKISYWTYKNGVWYFDDSADNPDDTSTGSYDPVTKIFTVDHKNDESLDNLYWADYSTIRIENFSAVFNVVNPDVNEIGGSLIIDNYLGAVIHLAAANGKSQILNSPTNSEEMDGRPFVVYLEAATDSAYTITINGIVLSVGNNNMFVWHHSGSYWESTNGDFMWGISVQYPYKYKTADKESLSDKIPRGQYAANVPYWKVKMINQPLRRWYSPEFGTVDDIRTSCTLPYPLTETNGTFYFYNPYTAYAGIKTSIPYKVRYRYYISTFLGANWLGLAPDSKCSDSSKCRYLYYASGDGRQLKLKAVSTDGTLDVEFTFGMVQRVLSGWKNPPSSIDDYTDEAVTITNLSIDGLGRHCWIPDDLPHEHIWFPRTLKFVFMHQHDTEAEAYLNDD